MSEEHLNDVRVSFDLERTDLERMAWARIRTDRSIWVAVLALLMLSGYQLLSGISRFVELLAAAGPLALVLCSPVVIRILTARFYARLKPFERSIRYRFFHDHFEVGDERQTSTLVWDAVSQAYENRDSFYLVHHKSIWRALPKRGFASAADIDRLRTILVQSLGPRARVVPGHQLGRAGGVA